jgi:hypothetical protein
VEEESEFSFVTVTDDGEVTARYSNVAEAKLAIKELRLIKRQLNVLKRQANESQRQMRADYTHQVRQRGSMMRGGGGIGRFVRAIQTAGRDAQRSQLASNLAPAEAKKRRIESIKMAVDQVILQVELYIHRC